MYQQGIVKADHRNTMNAHKEEYGDFRKRDPDEYSTGSGNEDHMDVKPNVLYFGTPVVLISSLDKEGNVNLSPMSSAWALGYNVILGLSTVGKTYENLNETGELTLNFPDRDLYLSALEGGTGFLPVNGARVSTDFNRSLSGKLSVSSPVSFRFS